MIEADELADPLTKSNEWKSLRAHQSSLCNDDLASLFSKDRQLFKSFSRQFNHLLYDFSKNLITTETLKLLNGLAEKANLKSKIEDLFSGKEINITEHRPALHTAIRDLTSPALQIDGQDVMPDIRDMRAKVRDISERLRAGLWLGATGKPIPQWLI